MPRNKRRTCCLRGKGISWLQYQNISFCIINNEQDQYDFDSLVGREDYEQLRQNAIQFWEDYVNNESCDRRLFDKITSKDK